MSALLSAGCATAPKTAPAVAEEISQRTGAAARLEGPLPAPGDLPPDVNLADGVTADEAVAIALWNNADFRTSVSALGFARADLIEAGLLRNPVLSLLFPVGPKQLEATLKWPIEVLWERPRRVAAARIASDIAARRLVQTGLDLAASTKLAFIDLALSEDRRRLAADTAEAVQRIQTLTESRLAAGDISELEASAARIDGARARQDAARAQHDVTLARDRLRAWLGFAIDGPVFEISGPDRAVEPCGAAASLIQQALASRPDARAAELAVEAAGARLGWEQSRILQVTAVLDANGAGREGFERGPGIDVGIPLFDHNQAGRTRAEAELERAAAAYIATQQRIALDVRQATVELDQARESEQGWRDTIVVPLETARTAAERSYATGDASYLLVLEHVRRLTDARLRTRELHADLERARVRVERAVGRACGMEVGRAN